MIKAHPLAGVGLNTAHHARSTTTPPRAGAEGWVFIVHNQFLLVWAETGILGFLAFIWLFRLALQAASRLEAVDATSELRNAGLWLFWSLITLIWALNMDHVSGAATYKLVFFLFGVAAGRGAPGAGRAEDAVSESRRPPSTARRPRARERSGMRQMMPVHIVSESESRTPLVSVIVPALNSAATIGSCMAALAAQHTAHLFEVIVVHSGEDDTCAVAARVLPAARAIQLPERALAARARAVGVGAARGDILAFIDSDAYAAPDWIDQVVRSADIGLRPVCGAIGNANPDIRVSRAEQLVMFSEFLDRDAGAADVVRAVGQPGDAPRGLRPLRSVRRDPRRGGPDLLAPAQDGRWPHPVLAHDAVFHDNRRRAASVPAQPAAARALHGDGAPGGAVRRLAPRCSLFLPLLPVAPAAKLAKIVCAWLRWCPRQLLALARAFPLVLLAVLAYGVGQVRGACAATGSLDDFGRSGSTTPASADDSTSPSQARFARRRRTRVRRCGGRRRRAWSAATDRAAMRRWRPPARRRRRAARRTRTRRPRPARGCPAMRVVTTGTPEAMASISTTGTPSAKLGSTKTSVS